ncbi:hypothetical protein QM797_03245 [Rhodococcus sp. IEGM 1381]|uniref:hypothetical protein n=1 Tax=Rhodococcus sp. IEGM 1381 TaxID=3047085 RepID=UPI0024B718E2|nr:hypothetical protein [Rhodococcus sp. IEGM 1381]MDI9893729.1 hypothetical protein [Rhodococcus sp. IEGM 1381]
MSTTVSVAPRGAQGGAVTARILPPGRGKIASNLVSDSSRDLRIDLDADGRESVVPP